MEAVAGAVQRMSASCGAESRGRQRPSRRPARARAVGRGAGGVSCGFLQAVAARAAGLSGIAQQYQVLVDVSQPGCTRASRCSRSRTAPRERAQRAAVPRESREECGPFPRDPGSWAACGAGADRIYDARCGGTCDAAAEDARGGVRAPLRRGRLRTAFPIESRVSSTDAPQLRRANGFRSVRAAPKSSASLRRSIRPVASPPERRSPERRGIPSNPPRERSVLPRHEDR